MNYLFRWESHYFINRKQIFDQPFFLSASYGLVPTVKVGLCLIWRMFNFFAVKSRFLLLHLFFKEKPSRSPNGVTVFLSRNSSHKIDSFQRHFIYFNNKSKQTTWACILRKIYMYRYFHFDCLNCSFSPNTKRNNTILLINDE